jgi:pyruvate dehydrogenase (quinone)
MKRATRSARRHANARADRRHRPIVKLIVLKNNSLGEVKFEQRELGNPEFGCELAPIDFVAYA